MTFSPNNFLFEIVEVTMPNETLEELKEEVKLGYLKKGHPFRYPVMASVNDGFPKQRTVVLRGTTADFDLYFYTDMRSGKIADFNKNPRTSLLFYHPKKLLQITISGVVTQIVDGSDHKEHWQRVQGNSRKDFTTANAPGTRISNPDEVEYRSNDPHFCLLKVTPDRMEYLRLKRPNHIRALFELNNEWRGSFLTP